MYKVIPGNALLVISEEGKFQRTELSNLRAIDNTSLKQNLYVSADYEIDGDFVTLTLFGERVRVSINWLWNIAKFEIFLPEGFERYIHRVSFVDTIRNRIWIDKEIVTRCYFDPPISIDPEWRIIPGYTRYAVNRMGVIKRIVDDYVLTVYIDETARYPRVNVYDPLKQKTMNRSIHRLVATAWCHNDDPVYKIEVNHKDGNKSNFHCTNLEWTTPSQNVKHATLSNLRFDIIPCRILDTRTKEIHSFNTLAAACKFMGLGPKRLNALLTRKAGHLLKKRYEFRMDGDKTPWFYLDNPLETKVGRVHVSVTDKDGNKKEYHSVFDLTKDYPGIQSRGFRFDKVIETLKMRNPDLHVVSQHSYNKIPCQAMNLETREIVTEKNPNLLSKKLGFHYAEVYRYFNEERWDYPYKGWVFRRQSDEPWIVSDEVLKYSRRRVTAVCQETGTKREFASIIKASEFFSVSDWTINHKLNTSEMIAGYTLTFS